MKNEKFNPGDKVISKLTDATGVVQDLLVVRFKYDGYEEDVKCSSDELKKVNDELKLYLFTGSTGDYEFQAVVCAPNKKTARQCLYEYFTNEYFNDEYFNDAANNTLDKSKVLCSMIGYTTKYGDSKVIKLCYM